MQQNDGKIAKKSVSEQVKLTKQKKDETRKTALIIGQEMVYKIFKESIYDEFFDFDYYGIIGDKSRNYESIMDNMMPLIHYIVKEGKAKFKVGAAAVYIFKENVSKIWYEESIDNIMIICDLLLRSYYAVPTVKQPIDHILSYVRDEYYIEDNKIYSKHNQKLIRAIKEINDKDLNDLLHHVSVSGDLNNGLSQLAKYLEEHHKLIDKKLGEKTTKAFTEFVNTKTIRHNNHKQTTATKEELLVFFDFGLSLVRLVKMWAEEK
jgi:hypothetical protein